MKKLLILTSVMIMACSKPSSKTTEISTESVEKSTKVYTLYLQMVHDDTLNTSKQTLLDSALSIEQMEKKDFIQSINHLKENPEQFNSILTEINEQINSMDKHSKKETEN